MATAMSSMRGQSRGGQYERQQKRFMQALGKFCSGAKSPLIQLTISLTISLPQDDADDSDSDMDSIFLEI
jgi:hypothetical protein